MLPPLLLQAGGVSEEAAQAQLIVSLIYLALFLVGAAVLGVWIYRDARRRGHNGIAWAIAWETGPVTGFFLFLFGLQAGRMLEGTTAYASWILLAGAVTLIVWFSTRHHEILYDASGRPIHPQAVRRLSRWNFAPGERPPSEAPPAPAPYAVPSYLPSGYARPGPPGAANRTVRCPQCQTVFSYVPSPYGRSGVECPNCHLRGSI